MFRSPSNVLLLGLAACGGPQATGRTEPTCPLDRTVVLSSQQDVARVAGCTVLSGLAIRTGQRLDLAPLKDLETVQGDLVVGPSVGLETVSFAELKTIGGTLQITSNNNLTSVLLPRLARAGRIEIEANVELRSVALTQLVTVDGSVVVAGEGSLQVLDLAGLTTVGKDLVIADNPSLTILELANLASAGEIRVSNNKSLPLEVVDGIGAKTTPP